MTVIASSDVAPGDAATLLRALRADVRPRFVAFGGAGAAYDVVAEDGDPDGAGGVLLIAFLEEQERWERVRALLAPRQGYLGSRLHRGDGDLVGLVRWSSPLMYARALQPPEIAASVDALPSPPALYLRT